MTQKALMNLLTVNVGSSSVRLSVYADGAQCLASAHHSGSETNIGQWVMPLLKQAGINHVDAVGHRIVHGGERFQRSCRIDETVYAALEQLTELAPLHIPHALAWVKACSQQFGSSIVQVAVFDTAFFAALPPVARTYALPAQLVRKHSLHRYGFHGLAHQILWRQWQARSALKRPAQRVISLQLGSGCSIAAILDGAPQDISMGFTPLEGLVMATRSGDLDPGAVLYLQRQEALSPAQTEALLNDQSGLLGISGHSGDMRELLGSQDPAARLAVDVYCYRARKYLGAYLAVLGGADAILFGGGVGENAPLIRARILSGLEWAGIQLDTVKNAAAAAPARFDAADSSVQLWALPVDESQLVAEETRAVLG
jgi:acetate kinase